MQKDCWEQSLPCTSEQSLPCAMGFSQVLSHNRIHIVQGFGDADLQFGDFVVALDSLVRAVRCQGEQEPICRRIAIQAPRQQNIFDYIVT